MFGFDLVTVIVAVVVVVFLMGIVVLTYLSRKDGKNVFNESWPKASYSESSNNVLSWPSDTFHEFKVEDSVVVKEAELGEKTLSDGDTAKVTATAETNLSPAPKVKKPRSTVVKKPKTTVTTANTSPVKPKVPVTKRTAKRTATPKKPKST